MAFVKATIDFKPASIGTGIKCQLRKGKASAATITLSLNAAAAKQANIADKDGIEVLIGDGPDHGMIRLRKNNSAANTKAEGRTTGRGAFFQIKLGHQPAFVDRCEAPAWCKWEAIDDGWIEIVLPKWADETAPNRKKPEPPSRVTYTPPEEKRADAGANIKTKHDSINTRPLAGNDPKRNNAGNTPKNVTAGLMGDPPPGRREMLQKMGEMKP